MRRGGSGRGKVRTESVGGKRRWRPLTQLACVCKPLLYGYNFPVTCPRHRPSAKTGRSAGDADGPSGPPREPLEVQLELLDLWHASLAKLLRAFKARFRWGGVGGGSEEGVGREGA